MPKGLGGSVSLVLPKLDGVTLSKAAASGLTQSYLRTRKSVRRMMDGAAKAQQNYSPKISTTISGSGWMTTGWEGFDLSSALTLSCGEAVTVASASNVIDITPNRRSDIALRAFAFTVAGEWIRKGFSTSTDEITVDIEGGATQYMVGYYPEFSAFIEIDQTGRQGWSLTAEEV